MWAAHNALAAVAGRTEALIADCSSASISSGSLTLRPSSHLLAAVAAAAAARVDTGISRLPGSVPDGLQSSAKAGKEKPGAGGGGKRRSDAARPASSTLAADAKGADRALRAASTGMSIMCSLAAVAPGDSRLLAAIAQQDGADRIMKALVLIAGASSSGKDMPALAELLEEAAPALAALRQAAAAGDPPASAVTPAVLAGLQAARDKLMRQASGKPTEASMQLAPPLAAVLLVFGEEEGTQAAEAAAAKAAAECSGF